MALTAIVTDPACVTPSRAVPVSCGNSNLDLLLVDWLNALIYEMSTRRMLFSRFEVHIDDQGHLDAYAWGEKIDTEKHKPAVEAKAATYFGLSVREEQPGRWVAQCVVDV
jgi:tRNA nucleotidyltransferase (CCA-adding enzyme)